MNGPAGRGLVCMTCGTRSNSLGVCWTCVNRSSSDWQTVHDCPKCPHDNGDHDSAGCWCRCEFDPNEWSD